MFLYHLLHINYSIIYHKFIESVTNIFLSFVIKNVPVVSSVKYFSSEMFFQELLVVLSLCLPASLVAEISFTSGASLIRNERFNIANFVFHGRKRLFVPGSVLIGVENVKECGFLCAGNSSCFSINFGTTPLFSTIGIPQDTTKKMLFL